MNTKNESRENELPSDIRMETGTGGGTTGGGTGGGTTGGGTGGGTTGGGTGGGRSALRGGLTYRVSNLTRTAGGLFIYLAARLSRRAYEATQMGGSPLSALEFDGLGIS